MFDPQMVWNRNLHDSPDEISPSLTAWSLPADPLGHRISPSIQHTLPTSLTFGFNTWVLITYGGGLTEILMAVCKGVSL